MKKIEPGAIVSEAIEIYGNNALVLLPIALVLYGIQAALDLAGVGVLSFVISIITATFYQGMVVELVRDVQDGRRDSSVGQMLASVRPVAVSLFIVSLLYGLGVGLGLVLLIVPGLYALTIWAVVAPVTVIERPRGSFAAFKRSRELVQGNGWAVFAAIFLVLLIALVIGIIAGILFGETDGTGAIIFTWLLGAFFAPISALIASVLYFNLAGRHSGWGEPRPEAPVTPGGPALDPPAPRAGGTEETDAFGNPVPPRPDRSGSVGPPGL